MKFALHLTAAAAGVVAVMAAAPAGAVVVTISAGPTGNGCTTCSVGPNTAHVGEVVTLDNDGVGPDQITLGPGSYTIHNAALTGLDSAWRFDGGNDWAWNFAFGSDNGNNTATIIDADWVNGVYSSQAAAAGATDVGTENLYGTIDPHGGTADFHDSFTLARTTTLDFFIYDYYLPDNVGGLAIDIEPASGAPEPAAWSLAMVGLGLVGGALRARRRPEGLLSRA